MQSKKTNARYVVWVTLLLSPIAGRQLAPSKVLADGLSRFERQAMGEWKETGGTISQLDPKGTAILLAKAPQQGRYSVSVRVRVPAKTVNQEAGLLLHFSDPDNFLSFSLKYKKSGLFASLRIARKKPGISFVADQAPFSSSIGEWVDLRAEVDGANVYGYVNNQPSVAFSFQGTPPPYNSHGKTWDPDPEKGRIGLFTVDAEAEYAEFRIGSFNPPRDLATPLRGMYDERGKLLPRRSYSETMKLFTDWFVHSEKVVNTEKAPKPLQNLPPFLLTNFVSTDDNLWDVGGEFAFNHALVMTGAVQYFIHSGDRRYLDVAKRTADWDIEHSTPATWAIPHLAASFVKFKPDGSWEGMEWGYEPDKSAYVGYALLKLHVASGENKYLDAALRIASTLSKLQGSEGNWPFRVNARTGEVKHSYTCSQLWYVWFFERLSEVTGDQSYLKQSVLAFQWLLKNPVRTNDWLGLYGDVASGARSFDQWVALETAITLLDRREQNPEYVAFAKSIFDWVNRMLVVDYGFFPTVPGLVEQSHYRVVLTHHQLRLAEIYAKLFEVTRKTEYKELAIEIANSVTWNAMSDGKIRQGFWTHAQAVPLILSFNDQFARIMSCIPETAPKQESHLLQTTSLVRNVQYESGQITYSTVARSYDYLTVASAPKSIRAGRRTLTLENDARLKPDAWSYDRVTGLLRINHSDPDVAVILK